MVTEGQGRVRIGTSSDSHSSAPPTLPATRALGLGLRLTPTSLTE